jgi:pilus assembly protein Flp/PilA
LESFLNWFFRDESGATAIEYGLLVGLIGLAIVAALRLLGPALVAIFEIATAALAGGG